ncbi:flippase-like domain-containing protein [Candidatus Woesearchaeota archaeon]|nr:flippase-like domain-containing protein [Candidatus Woesearchaeota archaeon]
MSPVKEQSMAKEKQENQPVGPETAAPPIQMSKKAIWKKALVTCSISIICFFILFMFIDVKEVISSLRKISISIIAFSFLLYLVSYWFRAWKFKVLFDNHVPMNNLIALVCAHTMASSILPARTGELTYFYFRKKVSKDHTFANSLASLAVVRIFDLAALLFIFLVSIALITIFPTRLVLPEPIIAVLLASGIGIAVIIFLLGMCVMRGKVMASALQKLMGFLHLNKSRIFKWIEQKGVEIITTLDSITKKQVFVLFFASLMVWVGNFIVGYLIVKDIGLLLPFSFIMIGFVATTLANALPIHGFASLGSLEGIWTIIFVALGAPEKIAISTGLGFHLVVIAFLIILGISGVIYLHWKKDKE